MDPIRDYKGEFLYQKIGSCLDEQFAYEMREEADKLGAEAFADPTRREFPIFNEKVAGASALYAAFQEIEPHVSERIKEACDLFNIEVEVPQEKVAGAAPDADDFLFPEHRKVQVSDAAQVKTAEILLRERRDDFDVMTRTYAYRRLQEKAATYGIALDEDSVPFCAEARCDVSSLCNSIHRRRRFVFDPQEKQAYIHLEHALREMKVAHIDDPAEKDKLAQLLFEMDTRSEITNRYNRPGDLGFPDPILAVFNTEKTANDFIDMAGREVSLDQIAGLDPESVVDIVGSEFMEDIMGPDGRVDPREMAQTLSILPSDMQEEIIQRLFL